MEKRIQVRTTSKFHTTLQRMIAADPQCKKRNEIPHELDIYNYTLNQVPGDLHLRPNLLCEPRLRRLAEITGVEADLSMGREMDEFGPRGYRIFP